VKPEMGVAIYRIFILRAECNPPGEVGFDRLKRGMGTELKLGISTFRIRLRLRGCRTLLATPWDWGQEMLETINHDRRRFVRSAAMTLAATQLGLIGSAKSLFAAVDNLPSFAGATGWLNSPPLTKAELHGKVVLIHFWTYSCINWRRTLPYVRAWAEKYKDHGLVVIGVHTPEFNFEQNLDNVCWATKDMRIDYPVALDDKYLVWRAFEMNIGRPSILPMRRGAFAITNSARANTQNRKG
jgi:thiol-disulfide isomerase/thioredoxin